MSGARMIRVTPARNVTLETITEHIETARALAHQMALMVPDDAGRAISLTSDGGGRRAAEWLKTLEDGCDYALYGAEGVKRSLMG